VLELTPAAAEVVAEIVSQEEMPDGAAMRITSEAGDRLNGGGPTRDIRLSVVESPEGDDQPVEGAPVYIESGATAEMLEDKVLDANVDEDIVEFRLIERDGDDLGESPGT
jgi:Fe-S cluster assembly iron-binding protein IscA